MFGFGKPNRQANILVYAVSAVVDGNVDASPIGLMPRFSSEYEMSIRATRRPRK